MSFDWEEFVLQQMGAASLTKGATLQTLWSGYGSLFRVELDGGKAPTAIVKHIVLPEESKHPRGWNTNLSHRRKERSYEVETSWYQSWSERCDEACRVPRCFGAIEQGQERVILLEDLDAAGFSGRSMSLSLSNVGVGLRWLAHFHACFLNESPEGLWPIGTYWHLDTRPDEWDVMEDSPLKDAAKNIDDILNECKFQTLVHGDAKVANFCFSKDGDAVAAVDFQYVGGGCGMKDVVYYLGSCLDEEDCEQHESHVLDCYFEALEEAIERYNKSVDWSALEAEWRALYAVAWTDFYRFLLGWMPGHWKVNEYSQSLAQRVLQAMGNV
ncbi:MAG: DUF1679 domain-containing protein [Deltaproteobacteria bacterium]|nr:MAG: DUF1679 domain-containing protein [Deltaproteobacteria bacterium]